MINRILDVLSVEWQDARNLYAENLQLFSADIGYTASWQEMDVFHTVQTEGSHTSISHGDKCLGYSRGIIALWHLLFHANSVTLLYTPEVGDVQLQPKVNHYWEDLRSEIYACLTLMRNSSLAWLAEYVVIGRKNIHIKGHEKIWHVSVKSGHLNPVSLAGSLADSFLLWIDYAGWLSDQYAELLMALMCSVKFRCCLISLPNKNTGFFYHTHHQLSVNCGGKWNAIRLNSEESPYLSQSELNLLLLQNGGRNTAHYKKNVLGEFEHG